MTALRTPQMNETVYTLAVLHLPTVSVLLMLAIFCLMEYSKRGATPASSLISMFATRVSIWIPSFLKVGCVSNQQGGHASEVRRAERTLLLGTVDGHLAHPAVCNPRTCSLV